MLEFSQAVVNGFIRGAIIALAALGLSLIYRVSRFTNVSHGDFMTLGAYITLFANRTVGAGIVLSSGLSILLTTLAGIIIYHVVFKPIEGRPVATHLRITSIGLALILRNLVAFFWGFNMQGYDIPPQRPLRFLGLRATPTEIVILLASATCMLMLFLLLRRTRLGSEIRAVSDLPELARVSGIDSRSITQWVWILGLAMASLAGVLLGAKTALTPNMGWDALLPAFAASVIGGVGNPGGAMLGAFIIGIAEQLSTFVVAESYKQGAAFTIMILVLLLRPAGLFARRVRA